MSKDLEHIDKFFEQKIGGSEFGPPDLGWAELSNSIDKRRGFSAFFKKTRKTLTGLLSILLITSWGIFSFADQMNITPNETTALSELATNYKSNANSEAKEWI